MSAVWPTVWTARATARRWRLARPPMAFLGTAIDTTYPAANAKLRQRIEKGGGAVCSEYPPGYQGKHKGHLSGPQPADCRAVSEVLCVAEARIRSGTLNTVGPRRKRWAARCWPCRAAFTAPISQGTNELLRTRPRRGAVPGSGRAGTWYGRGNRRNSAAAGGNPAVSPVGTKLSRRRPGRLLRAAMGPTRQKAVGRAVARCHRTCPPGRVLAACTETWSCTAVRQSQPGRRYVAL